MGLTTARVTLGSVRRTFERSALSAHDWDVWRRVLVSRLNVQVCVRQRSRALTCRTLT